MIAIDIREITSLKLLQPICLYLLKNNVPYIITHYDADRGSKEYNRASLRNISKSSIAIVSGAKKILPYDNDGKLLKIIRNNRVGKFVSIEVFLCYNKIMDDLKRAGVKVYSLQYFTDSVWTATPKYYREIDSVYFSSKLLMEKSIEYSCAKFDKKRHKFLGMPVYDQFENIGTGNNILVMLPNIRADYVNKFFKSTSRFMKIIEGLSKKGNLIFKTRKKQWMPPGLKKYSSDIIFDTDCMYPSSIVGALGKSYAVAIFFSSAVYESVMANKYVINIKTPLVYRNFNKKTLTEYFSIADDTLYNFSGVVETIPQNDIINGNFSVQNIDNTRLLEWKNKFVGNCGFNGAELIAKDILV